MLDLVRNAHTEAQRNQLEMARSISGLQPGQPAIINGKCVVQTQPLQAPLEHVRTHYLRHDLSEVTYNVRLPFTSTIYTVAYRRPCKYNSLGAFGGGFIHQLGIEIGSTTAIINLWDRYIRITTHRKDEDGFYKFNCTDTQRVKASTGVTGLR